MIRGALRTVPGGLTIFLVLAVSVAGGCGRRVLRSADVGSGDYYTREEYRHLTQEQREEYCAELADEADVQKGRRSSAEAERAEAVAAIRSASERSREIEAEIRGLQQAPAPEANAAEGATGVALYTVRSGDSLWRIAARLLGGGRRWKEIFNANRDRLHDAGLVPVGMVLKIPGRTASAASGKEGS